MRHRTTITCLLTALAISFQGIYLHPQTTNAPQDTSLDKLIDLGGHKLHFNCRGEAVNGSPTVVMEAGLNSSSETWTNIQPEIATFTRVCVYDRAGLGKSDPPPRPPRTSSQIAKDLHALLTKAGETGPLVVVGHSFGGIIVRMYASLYPKSVVGMVLVDSVHEEETAKWIAMMPPEIRKQMEASGGMGQFGGEQIDLPKSQAEMQAAKWHTTIPLVVLSRGKASYNVEDYPPQLRSLAPKGEELRIKMQKELARCSSRRKHMFAERSGHMIHHDQPEMVIDAIRQIVEATRLKDQKKF